MALRKAGYGETLDTLGNVAANTVKAILAIYIASKLARVGMAIARPAWGLASAPVRYPWRAYRWWRGRGKYAPADLPGPAPFAMGGGMGAPVSVYVMNWPAGGVGCGSDTYVDGNGRTRRKGSRVRPGRPAAPVPRSRLGLLWRHGKSHRRTVKQDTGREHGRALAVRCGWWVVGGGLRDMGQRARGLLVGATARLSGFTGWLGRSVAAQCAWACQR